MCETPYHILVVDDSKRDALLLERFLTQSAATTFTITRAASAQAGLEALGSTDFDLVLLDYYLPDMDGLMFLAEMQRRRLSTPAIMLSAFDQDRLPVQALQAGAVDYYRKDQVYSGMLGKAIQQAIETSRLQVDAAELSARIKELETIVGCLQQQLEAQSR